MSNVAPISDRSLGCPNLVEGEVCSQPLYVRHTEAGTLDQVQGRHYITNIVWQAECHACQWESPRRSTEWALIRTVQDLTRTAYNS